MSTCTVPGCDREHHARGLCQSHFCYLRRTGTMPTRPYPSRDPVARFWSKVNKDGPGGCWLWTAASNQGYGAFQYEGRVRGAHRVSLILSGVDVPEHLSIDHLCRVTLCVNPAHLEVVTQGTNVLRGESPPAGNATKTHCPKGHPYEGDNLYVNPTTGYRLCKACNRARGPAANRRYRARKKAA